MSDSFVMDIRGSTPANDYDELFRAAPQKSALLEERFATKPFRMISAETPLSYDLWAIDSLEGETSVHSTAAMHALTHSNIKMRLLHELGTHAQPDSPAERTNIDRVTLLARKYVSREIFSDEESARLAILTERLRQLVPAVSSKQLENLENSLKQIMEISESNSSIRKQVSLD